jgi:hypothetical protein
MASSFSHRGAWHRSQQAFTALVRQIEHGVEERNRTLADEVFQGLKPGA